MELEETLTHLRNSSFNRKLYFHPIKKQSGIESTFSLNSLWGDDNNNYCSCSLDSYNLNKHFFLLFSYHTHHSRKNPGGFHLLYVWHNFARAFSLSLDLAIFSTPEISRKKHSKSHKNLVKLLNTSERLKCSHFLNLEKNKNTLSWRLLDILQNKIENRKNNNFIIIWVNIA